MEENAFLDLSVKAWRARKWSGVLRSAVRVFGSQPRRKNTARHSDLGLRLGLRVLGFG